MANNYFQFAQTIDDLTDSEAGWLRFVLRTPDGGTECRAIARQLGDVDDWKWLCYRQSEWPSFSWEIEEDQSGRYILLHDGGDCNLDDVIVVVEEFLERFRPDSVFVLEWARTCSAPRPGHFGGGAAVITGDETTTMSTAGWARNTVTSETPNRTEFSGRETAMILAGLRMMQHLQVKCDGFDYNENEVATNDETLIPLTPEEIEKLCRRINCG